ncbi:hypothetical protein DXZ75_05205 [Streptomyces sp. AcE210]|nr:hypothetical protein DXZ75_05205 [Streptomyces sp. AcE210]
MDVSEFLRPAGLPDVEELLDDSSWGKWRGGRARPTTRRPDCGDLPVGTADARAPDVSLGGSVWGAAGIECVILLFWF